MQCTCIQVYIDPERAAGWDGLTTWDLALNTLQFHPKKSNWSYTCSLSWETGIWFSSSPLIPELCSCTCQCPLLAEFCRCNRSHYSLLFHPLTWGMNAIGEAGGLKLLPIYLDVRTTRSRIIGTLASRRNLTWNTHTPKPTATPAQN